MPRHINDDDDKPKRPWLPLLITLGVGALMVFLFWLDVTHPEGIPL